MEKINYFSADYRDGLVTMAGKTYPAGTFATHLLNQYYENDTVARISVFTVKNWHLQDTLEKGYVDPDLFEEAGAKPRKPGPGDLLLACSDACIAAQNAVVAAQSLGIGACYIGDVMENREAQCELLGLPKYVFPVAMVVFGYPTQQQLERPKPQRCRIDEIVMKNRYQVRDGQALRAMTEKDWKHTDFENWATRFCDRKFNSDFSREMSRSVGEYLKEYT